MPDRLTPEQLDDLEHLEKAATKGPWKTYQRELPWSELGHRTFGESCEHPIVERNVETAWAHPQVHAPIPIFFVASSPYAEPMHHAYVHAGDAAFIAES